MSVHALIQRSGGVIGTIGPIGGKGVWSLRERGLLAQDFYDDVSLLLHCNGANGGTTFLDSSKNALAITRNGNAQISTAQSKFGGASLYLDGTGDYLSLANNPLFDFGTGEFTIEMWFYIAGNSNQDAEGNRLAVLFSAWPSSGVISTDYAINIGGTSATTGTFIGFGRRLSGTLTEVNYVATITQQVWHHVAVTRSGSNLTVWYDGSAVATNSSFSGNVNTGGHPIKIGGRIISVFPHALNGYIDDLRITKGVARYTGSFTPPQRQFRP